MESQKVEGLISSVNYEICHCGKKPNSIWRDCKRKRKRRKKRKIEYEMPKPNPFGEKGMAAPSSSNLHYFLFMFLLILINGENPNSDRSWVMIFRTNRVFPTKDLSHCNHRPIFLLSAKQLNAMNRRWCFYKWKNESNFSTSRGNSQRNARERDRDQHRRTR